MKRLINIQQAIKVKKDKQGYGYQYRDAEQILAACKDALAENRCAIVCHAEYVTIEGNVFKKVIASLVGENGNVIASASDMVKSPSSMKGMVDQQVSGSDTTYCKRYALQNLLAIDNEDMDIDNPNGVAKKAVSAAREAISKQSSTNPQPNPENSLKSQLLKACEEMSATEDMEQAKAVWVKYQSLQQYVDFQNAKMDAKIRLNK